MASNKGPGDESPLWEREPRLDLDILNKPWRLTPDEYEHVKLHTRYGYDLLQNESNIHPDISRAVLEHHERPDGRGYPMGRVQGAVQPLSALISVVDAYNAITSRRSFSAARSHHEALGILWKECIRTFPPAMVEALIRFLGWITPGRAGEALFAPACGGASLQSRASTLAVGPTARGGGRAFCRRRPDRPERGARW